MNYKIGWKSEEDKYFDSILAVYEDMGIFGKKIGVDRPHYIIRTGTLGWIKAQICIKSELELESEFFYRTGIESKREGVAIDNSCINLYMTPYGLFTLSLDVDLDNQGDTGLFFEGLPLYSATINCYNNNGGKQITYDPYLIHVR